MPAGPEHLQYEEKAREFSPKSEKYIRAILTPKTKHTAFGN